MVRWRRDNDEIKGKYSQLLNNNTLVIENFSKEDTGKSFSCYIRKIGSDDFLGEYPESGPRRLLMLGELWGGRRERRGRIQGGKEW